MLLALLSAQRAAGQGVVAGRIEGAVIDSVHTGPLVGVVVRVVRTDTEPDVTVTAITDGRGRFRFERVPPGRYAVGFVSRFLDSLEYAAPPRPVVVRAGQAVRVPLAVPSRATLQAAACPGVSLGAAWGALVGLVSDADAERPLAGATVALVWQALAVDSASRKLIPSARTALVTTDSAGAFHACGVPVRERVLVQVQLDGRVGAVVPVEIPAEAGVLVRNLSFSRASAPTAAAVQAAMLDSDSSFARTGTATLVGTVRRADGQPIADAQVRVAGTAAATRTSTVGEYTLGGLPAGTHELIVQQIGYGPARPLVDLRGGQTVRQDVRLERLTALDSVRVLARRAQYPEFEAHREKYSFGRFLDEEQIAARPFGSVAHVLATLPGWRVVAEDEGHFGVQRVNKEECLQIGIKQMDQINIVIDGHQHMRLADVDRPDIVAVESYSTGWMAPWQYDRACGIIVIWTSASRKNGKP